MKEQQPTPNHGPLDARDISRIISLCIALKPLIRAIPDIKKLEDFSKILDGIVGDGPVDSVLDPHTVEELILRNYEKQMND